MVTEVLELELSNKVQVGDREEWKAIKKTLGTICTDTSISFILLQLLPLPHRTPPPPTPICHPYTIISYILKPSLFHHQRFLVPNPSVTWVLVSKTTMNSCDNWSSNVQMISHVTCSKGGFVHFQGKWQNHYLGKDRSPCFFKIGSSTARGDKMVPGEVLRATEYTWSLFLGHKFYSKIRGCVTFLN